MRSRRYPLDARVLSLFFLVAMPFVAFGSFIVIRLARTALQESLGSSLEQRAVETKLLVERYLANEFVRLRLLSTDPMVRAAVATPAPRLAPEARREIENAWAAGDAGIGQAIVGSPLAARLREVAQVVPGVRLLQVVDAGGRLVASSARGGRILNAETAWFRAFASGRDRPWMSDVQRAASNEVAVFEIAYPILDADGQPVGALRGVFDSSDLYSVLAPVRLGATGHAVLLRATDGMVLASDEGNRVLRETFPGFDVLSATRTDSRGDSLWDSMRDRDKAPSAAWPRVAHKGFRMIPAVRGTASAAPSKDPPRLVEPARIVGYSPVEQVPDVQWLVAVEQDLDEALAPIQGVTGFLWLHFVGVFLTVILLAVYFSFELEKPVIEEELHLHEEHVPSGVKAT
jgi:hypothetical protein